ncbi:MAG: peptide ABC transporter substrate-binding protein [Anaerolineales bacterium]|nr:peptide ABC transporter substrate-binding protein [Anaerolineales bacterium]
MMKPDIRLQGLLALVCLGLILSLLTVQAQSANLCTVQVPASGGSLVEGVVGRPQYINPLLADANQVDRDLVNLVFDGLTRYDDQGQLVPALARGWQVSEDNLTVTFTLRDDVTWQDGQPFTSADVAFTYGLMQDDAYTAVPGLARLWQAVTITPLDAHTISFTLPTPYSPFLEATTRGILPAHLLPGITAATLPAAAFNQAPVGTGPFIVESGDWTRSGRLRLRPNPAYWRGGVQLDAIEYRFFPDVAAAVTAYQDGAIYAINRIPAADLPRMAALPGMRLFSAPESRYTQLIFNLTASGLAAVRDKAVRQALAYGLDRPQLVDAAVNGQGVVFEGPYLPNSWTYNADALTVYATNPLSATTLLAGAGWTLVNDSVRQKEDVSLSLRLLFPDTDSDAALAAGIAAQWAAIGVETVPQPVALVDLPAALLERAYDVALVEITPLGDPDLYDFWSQEAVIRGRNYGGWNNRRASEALEEARQLWPQAERRTRYNRFLFFFDNDLPAFTLYQHVFTYGLSQAVNQQGGSGLADIGLIHQPRDRYRTLPDWFLVYRDVLVACPETATPSPP